MKKIAICLYGHCRTFDLTYKNFFKFIVEANQEDGYGVDLFFHTWDVYHDSFSSWHNYNGFLNKIKLNAVDRKRLVAIYGPKRYAIEKQRQENLPSRFIGVHLKYAADFSLDRVNQLRESYEKEQRVCYEYILYTRMDIMFLYPFKINMYLDSYKNKELRHFAPKQKEKILFSCNNAFVRFKIADPRYPNESDLIWFANFSSKRPHLENVLCVLTDYRMHCHFYVCRSNLVSEENVWKRLDALDRFFICNNEKFVTAKSRIHNQLSYKLGQAMILNSKTLFGYIRMPFVLWYIASKHRRDQKVYQEKIKKDPSKKLSPLESYPDYREALKEKECLTYKLGEALIKANNTSFIGGGGVYWVAT